MKLMCLCTILFSNFLSPAFLKSQPAELPDSYTEPATGISFVKVNGGCFQMGCGEWYWSSAKGSNCENDEKPVRRIYLDSFLIGRYEVTQQQWLKVMGYNPSCFQNTKLNLPVESVTWNEVQEFIARLTILYKGPYRFRLPSEAEWEYACRSGGEAQIFCGGNENGPLAWYRVTSSGRTHPVGKKQPNGLGLYDMSGNVREWCNDYYGLYSMKEKRNPAGPSQGSSRVVRGGAWGDHYSRFCRSAFRDQFLPQLKSKFIGFRLVLFLPNQ